MNTLNTLFHKHVIASGRFWRVEDGERRYWEYRNGEFYGVLVGFRIKQNGRVAGGIWKPEEDVPACMVSFDPERNPVPVPPDQVRQAHTGRPAGSKTTRAVPETQMTIF